MNRGSLIFAGVLAVLFLFVMGSYNGLVKMDEAVTQGWAQVENVYQRRLDLIPNLVETVKGYAAHEKSTFLAVTEARAKAASTLAPDLTGDPQKFAQFQESQGTLSSALSRLMVVVEQYPELKANGNFLDLQTQLEGTENRISVERGRYNEAAQAFNAAIRTFPRNMMAHMMGLKSRSYFKADEGAGKAPKVQF